MYAQLSSRRIPFRFFDAVRVQSMPSIYDTKARLKMYGSQLTLGEIGCYLSHRQIWADLAQTNDEVWCVLEDDVEICPDFERHVAALLDARADWDIVRLTQGQPRACRIVKSLRGDTRLVSHGKQPGGTYGYLISGAAARVLHTFSEHMIHPVDDMMNRHWEHGLRMYCACPDLLRDRGDLFETTIAGRAKAKRSLVQKFRREFYMGKDSLSRRLYNRRQLIHCARLPGIEM
ncbi:hypothetical protein PSUB009319_42840 [Ralstonia sp. SET104]|nr:hypothetical protein PSUB009319_42840 [Ralstonia sp. SET104]